MTTPELELFKYQCGCDKGEMFNISPEDYVKMDLRHAHTPDPISYLLSFVKPPFTDFYKMIHSSVRLISNAKLDEFILATTPKRSVHKRTVFFNRESHYFISQFLKLNARDRNLLLNKDKSQRRLLFSRVIRITSSIFIYLMIPNTSNFNKLVVRPLSKAYYERLSAQSTSKDYPKQIKHMPKMLEDFKTFNFEHIQPDFKVYSHKGEDHWMFKNPKMRKYISLKPMNLPCYKYSITVSRRFAHPTSDLEVVNESIKHMIDPFHPYLVIIAPKGTGKSVTFFDRTAPISVTGKCFAWASTFYTEKSGRLPSYTIVPQSIIGTNTYQQTNNSIVYSYEPMIAFTRYAIQVAVASANYDDWIKKLSNDKTQDFFKIITSKNIRWLTPNDTLQNAIISDFVRINIVNSPE